MSLKIPIETKTLTAMPAAVFLRSSEMHITTIHNAVFSSSCVKENASISDMLYAPILIYPNITREHIAATAKYNTKVMQTNTKIDMHFDIIVLYLIDG